ncbi:hypothetical protein E1B28_001385 [Marasmius oreades]|uniref:BZIP domain-containing protein n=1 Tax=Marasmius oreades TaxID=181124 RepID=A0A9P8AFC5_9AGAR|nr:uncharacterized protein E1B28_001385 [Marasmius oreades]KAG7099552.1 hypothetical protein E1B28_001385 [Marasmius oreades]
MVFYPPLDASNINELALLQTELDRWQTLDFSFDMDDEPGQHESFQGKGPQQSTSSVSQNSQSRVPSASNISDAVLLAQFAANAGSLPSQPNTMNSYSALLNYFQSQGINPATLPPGPTNPTVYHNPFGQTYTSPAFSPWQQAPNHHPFHSPRSPAAGFLAGGTLFQGPVSLGVAQPEQTQTRHYVPSRSPLPAGPSSPKPSSAAATPHPVDDEAAATAIAEDKRQRNTAASARFRIKKKLRNLNLEQTVSELSGRADILEREAADLRRENGWLKEIVMLKGSRMAGIDISPHTIPNLGEGSSMAQADHSNPASNASKDHEESESDEDNSGDYLPEGKGKAKARSKKEKRR